MAKVTLILAILFGMASFSCRTTKHTSSLKPQTKGGAIPGSAKGQIVDTMYAIDTLTEDATLLDVYEFFARDAVLKSSAYKFILDNSNDGLPASKSCLDSAHINLFAVMGKNDTVFMSVQYSPKEPVYEFNDIRDPIDSTKIIGQTETITGTKATWRRVSWYFSDIRKGAVTSFNEGILSLPKGTLVWRRKMDYLRLRLSDQIKAKNNR